MLRTDDVERLSRFRAGELSDAEAKALQDELQQRPELQRALKRLERLDAISPLPSGEGQGEGAGRAEDDALTRAVVQAAALTPKPTSTQQARPAWRGRMVAVLAIAAGLAVFGYLSWRNQSSEPDRDRANGAEQIATSGSAKSVPPPSAANDPLLAPPGPNEITIYGGAIAGGMVFWTPETKLTRGADGTVELSSGTVIAQTHGGTVRAQGTTVSVDGEVVVSTEPENAFAHVTRALAGHPGGKPMKEKLEQFRTAQAAWMGAALVVFTLDGEARATPPSSTQVAVVKKGSAWTQPAQGSTSQPRAVQQALEGTPQKGDVADPQSVRERSARVVDGEIDLRAVHGVVLAHWPELMPCFTSAQAQSPTLSGAVTLQLSIGADGKLSDASIDQDYSLQNPFVSACVLEKLSALTWPRPSSGSARVAYPLGFERRGTVDAPGASLVFPKDAVDADGETIAIANPDRAKRADVSSTGALSLGAPNAPVTVVEFSEFECSFCQKAWPVAKQLQAKYGDRVRIVFRQRPLARGSARLAAQASLAAAEQGKFWEYGDLLFANPEAHDRVALESYAAKLGLDLLRFREAMDSERVAKQIDADLAEADRVGAKSVPIFFVNGKEIVGARPLDTYSAAIDAELSAKP